MTTPSPERDSDHYGGVWEVWEGNTLICSREMRLNQSQAENKVWNERRRGSFMEARPARKGPAPKWYSPEGDD